MMIEKAKDVTQLDMQPYIFISYAHKDSPVVLPLIRGLQARELNVWYDTGIEAGAEWPEYIADKLMNSGCVIAFMSANAAASQNCRREINFSVELKKPFLVVYLEDVELSPGLRMQLNTLQAMFLKNSPSTEAFLNALSGTAILAPCRSTPEPAPQPVKPACEDAQYQYTQGMLALKEHREDAGEQWLLKAAAQGHRDAMYALGRCYEYGIGTEKDKANALHLYKVLVLAGHEKALAKLWKLQPSGVPLLLSKYRKARDSWNKCNPQWPPELQFYAEALPPSLLAAVKKD